MHKKIIQTLLSGLCVIFIGACQSPAVKESAVSEGTAVPKVKADKLLVVDCSLPGQVKKLGSALTYLTPRRPVRTTAIDCEIRGGEYTAYDRADYRTALNVWLPAAKEGDAAAQTYVGEIFEKGLGTEPDFKLAAQWYQKAADQGHSRAQINLGYLYEKGLGVEKNLPQALNLYRRASGLENSDLEFASVVEVRVASEKEQQMEVLRREVARSKEEADSLRTKLAATQTKLSKRQASLQSAEQELEKLRAQVSQRRNEIAGIATQDVEFFALEVELKKKEKIVDQQRQEMAWLETELNQQKSRLTRDLEVARRQEQQIQRQLVGQNEEMEKLRAQLDSSQKLLLSKQTELAKLTGVLEAERTSLKQAKQSTEVLSADKQAEIAKLEQTLKAREQELAQQKAQIASLETETGSFKTQLDKMVQAAQKQVALAGPSIEILDPPIALTRGEPSVTLRSVTKERLIVGKVTAPAGLVTFSVNDRPANTADNGLFRVNVPVEESKTPVSVVAIDKQGRRAAVNFSLIPKLRDTKSAPVVAAQSPREAANNWRSIDFGGYYALIIGNNDYPNFPNLDSAINDAKRADNILRTQYGFKTTLLLNADRYAILSNLNKLREQLTEKDNLLIYYAGHGELDRVNLRGHWLPVDAEPNSTANWISNVDITDILNAISAKHILVIADSCYSGTMTRSSMARLDAGRSEEALFKWMKVMSKTRSRTVLTSGGLKPVLDSGGGKHSVFANAFFDVLEKNQTVMEGYTIYRNIADQVRKAAAKFSVDQEPRYAPIKHGGHESGEFFFVPTKLRS